MTRSNRGRLLSGVFALVLSSSSFGEFKQPIPPPETVPDEVPSLSLGKKAPPPQAPRSPSAPVAPSNAQSASASSPLSNPTAEAAEPPNLAAPQPNPAETSLPPIKLMEFFSVDKNPGSGSLLYKQGERTEAIGFGNTAGFYGVGMIFKGSTLPEPYRHEFKKKRIFQVAFGSLRPGTGLIPQFAAISIIANAMPEERMVFQLTVPNAAQPTVSNSALLLFTSPSTPVNQADEDKLKTTFFAQSGTLTLIPKDKPRSLEIRSQGKKFAFKWQLMGLQFEASLVTPFSAQENTLKGIVEFPVYWPSGEDSERLAARIATESLGGLTDPGAASPTSKRDVSSSPKRK